MHDIALRKTHCKLDSEHIVQHKQLIREQGLIPISGNYVDATGLPKPQICVDVNNKTHSDDLEYCRELHYTEFKGIKEESDNKMKLENGKKYKLKLKNGTTEMAVFNNEQVDHFDFCNIPGSIMLDDVEVTMNDNKHPHHDLIVEWVKDVSKSLQCYMENAEVWVECYINPVISDTVNDYKFRIKPEREFFKGHWYPCTLLANSASFPLRYNGDVFMAHKTAVCSYDEHELKIGESLGPLSFPKV